MLRYKGYEISREHEHIKVVSPDGSEWTADNTHEALQEIREKEENHEGTV